LQRSVAAECRFLFGGRLLQDWRRENRKEKGSRQIPERSNASYSHASEIAVIYAALGDNNQAMSWLEKGYEERFNPGVLLRPGFDPLRSDLRFQELVRRVGLSP